MKLLFSEFNPEYAHYRYPYVIWAVPEAHETPADLYGAGFHPVTPDLRRFTLCRHLRVPLAGWQPTSENRRILRQGEGLELKLIPRDEYPLPPDKLAAWLAFAEARFGTGIMRPARLEGVFHGAVTTHVLSVTDLRDGGREVGAAVMYLEPPRMAHYYYAFYELDHRLRSLGLWMMTAMVRHFAEQGFAHAYLGTCYSERALYKAQFSGLEFFNGVRWSPDLAQLKFLVRRDAAAMHLLLEPEFLAAEGGMEALETATPFRHAAKAR
ncbi:MAG: GNAT family N-acetyltransferase [Limisphaerales bacterium]